MKRPPAFQFYVKDWRSNSTVLSMAREQRGDFVDMLAASWDQEEPGTLPLPLELAAKICGLSVRSCRKFVESFPKLWQIDGNRLVNPELREQWTNLQELKQKQSDAAGKTNRKRWEKPSVTDSVSGRSAFAFASASAIHDHNDGEERVCVEPQGTHTVLAPGELTLQEAFAPFAHGHGKPFGDPAFQRAWHQWVNGHIGARLSSAMNSFWEHAKRNRISVPTETWRAEMRAAAAEEAGLNESFTERNQRKSAEAIKSIRSVIAEGFSE